MIGIKQEHVVDIIRRVLYELFEAIRIRQESLQESRSVCDRKEDDRPLDVGIVDCSVLKELLCLLSGFLYLDNKRGSDIARYKGRYLC